MQFAVIQRILGLLLLPFSLTMLPPLGISLLYGDGVVLPFLLAFFIILSGGLILWWPVRGFHRDLRLRDGFVVVTMFWAVLGITGALPLMLAEHPHMPFTDAVFESVSGLTTTGATVLTGIDALPPSILFYRQELQWLGGMGIIVLALAVLPMLGVGGMQLYRAEMPGPTKDKLTPRIAETAKALWYIYLALTVACALAYWFAGMSGFDAITHSFATLSTGGFSTHDASMGYFESPLIEMIAVVFMLLAGVNFSLHFVAWHSFSVKPYFRDPEFRTYLFVLGGASLVTIAYLYLTGTFLEVTEDIHHGLFQVVSIATSTGFTTANFSAWPDFLPVLLIFISFIGGCAGSTAGGMKVIRFLLLFKQGVREVIRLIHPNAQVPIKVGPFTLNERLVDSVWGFFAAYVATFALMLLALMATGLDQVTAFSAVAACINNLGPGLGKVAAHFGDINAFAKWVLAFAMIMGRLEIFTVLVLLTPAFWRR
ncbi:MAG: potassium transporter [Gammaproteobacteria bacterium]|nr:MAG: potassium transporter [Gammaproteobacteria bacterium]